MGAALLALLATGGCGRSRSAQAGPGGPAGPVEVGVVTTRVQEVPLTTELPGRTSAYAVSEIRPQISGLIRRRLFTEGSDVRAGQALYRIDPAPYRATLDQAEATVESARANVVTTRLKSERFDTLAADNAVSKQDRDDARAAAQQAVALLRQNGATRRSAAINLGYTTIRAPISGRIGRSAVTQGALVAAAQADALTSIQALDPIYVDVNQSSAALLKLRAALNDGDRVRGANFFAVRLKLEDGSLYPLSGRMTVADAVVDQDDGSVTLRAVFPNPRHVLLPGMYARALVQQGVPTSAVTVPQQAVSRDPKGNAVVMVADAHGNAAQRVVEATQPVGTMWLVTAGLRPGERVIVEGLQKVRPGMPVHAVPAGSRPATPPPGAPAARQPKN